MKVGHSAFADESVLYLGRDIGLFKKHGINIELIYIPGGSVAMQALIRQESGPVIARWNAIGLRPIERRELADDRWTQQQVALCSHGAREHHFCRTVKGQEEWALSRFGSNTDFVVKLAATQLGLNPKRDIQVDSGRWPRNREMVPP